MCGRAGELTHPEEVIFHMDGKLVASQPQQADGRWGEFWNTAADAGQLTADQLLLVQRRLAEQTCDVTRHGHREMN